MEKKTNNRSFILMLILIIISSSTLSLIDKDTNIRDKSLNEDYSVTPFLRSSYTVNKTPFIVARTSNPVTFDPIDSWDDASNDVLHQITEPLIFFDYPTMSLVPALAVSWSWDVTATNLTLILRDNVFFHDGTEFNASSVKWNFDRLNYFGNTSGTLPAGKLIAHPASIYQFNSTTPIMKVITINSRLNVTIELNRPFAPFEGLLAYAGSNIISPTAHSFTEYIDLSTDLVVGTGPFILDSYVPDSEIRFHAYHNYWGGKAEIEEMIYLYFQDSVTANNAMLTGDIDFLGTGMASLKPTFVADPNIHVEEVGTSTIYWFIAFNPLAVNLTWRKAIQHAFNYTYFLEETEGGTGIRGRSLVPPGFPGRNDSVMAADFDIPAARQLLIDDGIAPAGWDIGSQVGDVFTPGANEADWTGAYFRNLNFRTRPGSNFYQLLLTQIVNNMLMIGLGVVEQAMEWADYITNARLDPDFMNIFFSGKGPDYFETFNMIDPLVNPASSGNYAQINITEINTFLALAAAEPDETTRYGYYETLQYLIHDKYYVHMPLEYDLLYVVHTEDLEGFPYNINNDLYFYPCKWNKTTLGFFTLSSNAGSPDNDGSFTLTWDASALADNYSIYRSNSPITLIDGSVTEIASGIVDLSYPISGLNNGSWYFMVVAFNEDGNKSSNSLNIVSHLVPPPGSFTLSSNAGSPDIDGSFNLTWDNAAFVDNYSLYTSINTITSINNTTIILANQSASSPYLISGLSNGTYYYIVVAFSEAGSTLSNSISVTVQIPSQLPGIFTLSSNAENPDADGTFNLLWTASESAENYSVYLNDGYITEINQSVILLEEGVTSLLYVVMGLNDGDYFFIIIAYNVFGMRKSNCLSIEVGEQSSVNQISFGNYYFLLILIGVASTIYITKKKN